MDMELDMEQDMDMDMDMDMKQDVEQDMDMDMEQDMDFTSHGFHKIFTISPTRFPRPEEVQETRRISSQNEGHQG